jgi:SAM-dependent methyltransferase
MALTTRLIRCGAPPSVKNPGMPTEHERRNRAFWDADADDYQAAHGAVLDAAPAAWGVWRIAESEIGALGDVGGLDVLELGCGAAQWAVALAGAGARAVGLDQSRGQIRHARAARARAGADVGLVVGSAEAVPFAAASFDLVFCDHGAMSFCDPERTVAEAARLLRPGGRLVWCASSALHYVTYDDERDRPSRRLRRSWFDLGLVVEPEGTADWVLTPGEWIRVLRRHGLIVEDLLEVRAPKEAQTSHPSFDHRWSRKWPAEEIWQARKPAAPTSART